MTKVRNTLMSLVAAVVLAGVASCGGGGGYSSTTSSSGQATVVRSASLTGAQEVPPVVTGATGRGAVVVNPTTMEITGGVTFTGLSGNPTGAHIHRADTNIVFALVQAADNATATVPANTVLLAADYAELLAGTLYFNVHTAANPNGEIRGQIAGQGGVIAGLATLNAAQETPINSSTATGRGTIVVDSTTRQILVCYATHNVTGATAAHIHTGVPGIAGPADVVTLTAGTNVYFAPFPTTLTAQNVADLTVGYTYFNIHSGNCGTCAGGEIRGQIGIQ